MRALGIVCGSLVIASLFAGRPQAQTDDVFAFIPSGGKTLLTGVLQSKPPADDAKALLTGKHSRQEWLSLLQARRGTVERLKRLRPEELLTLADYLSHNMPLAASALPADPAKANWDKLLPMDGRDMALDYCQGCHIITVVVTQDRTQAAWLGSMNKPSHVGIKLTAKQREALASYLVLNAAIPIDDVPEELRAGGASY